MDLEQICMAVCQTARRAGEFIELQRAGFSRSSVEMKGHNDMVTYVDKESEKMIVDDLKKIMPGAGVVAEEGSDRDGDEYCWIVDPLDGTTNFIHGLAPYCVSIGLMRGHRMVVGVVYEIRAKECFYAWEGSKAYMNGAEIGVSSEGQISKSLIMTGTIAQSDGVTDRFNMLFDYFNHNSHGARRSGSAAANLVYVAAGRAECFFQKGLSPWDVAAGSLIVERAGGRVTDYGEGCNFVFGREIVATNGATHSKLLEVIK